MFNMKQIDVELGERPPSYESGRVEPEQPPPPQLETNDTLETETNTDTTAGAMLFTCFLCTYLVIIGLLTYWGFYTYQQQVWTQGNLDEALMNFEQCLCHIDAVLVPDSTNMTINCPTRGNFVETTKEFGVIVGADYKCHYAFGDFKLNPEREIYSDVNDHLYFNELWARNYSSGPLWVVFTVVFVVGTMLIATLLDACKVNHNHGFSVICIHICLFLLSILFILLPKVL